jgi:hypothetical protein
MLVKMERVYPAPFAFGVKMKIIQEANPAGWSYRFTCTNCLSVCEADHNDVRYNYSAGDGPHGPTTYYNVSCPVCKENHALLKLDEIPKIVLLKAKERFDKIRNYSGRD